MVLPIGGSHIIVIVVSAAILAWLQQRNSLLENSNSSTPEALPNQAFVFVKPHANTAATRELVRHKLVDAGITILAEMEIDGSTIDTKKLIDKHYYAIASKATILPPQEIPVPTEKFQEFFGETWETVLQENRAVNAMTALEKFDCSAQELDEAWRQAEIQKRVVKLGGGFYCGLIKWKEEEEEEKPLYVFNAFFMSMRSKFVNDGASIHGYSVEWNPRQLSWKQFRNEVLGPTNPAEAPVGSIRREIFNQYQTLGLSYEPNKGDNGVHASASPLEGLVEQMNWLEQPMTSLTFGKALLKAGISEKTVKEWSLDPQVNLPPNGESKGSLFDALEDLDVMDCLDKMKEVNKLIADDDVVTD